MRGLPEACVMKRPQFGGGRSGPPVAGKVNAAFLDKDATMATRRFGGEIG
jgi:hypothetical protein